MISNPNPNPVNFLYASPARFAGPLRSGHATTSANSHGLSQSDHSTTRLRRRQRRRRAGRDSVVERPIAAVARRWASHALSQSGSPRVSDSSSSPDSTGSNCGQRTGACETVDPSRTSTSPPADRQRAAQTTTAISRLYKLHNPQRLDPVSSAPRHAVIPVEATLRLRAWQAMPDRWSRTGACPANPATHHRRIFRTVYCLSDVDRHTIQVQHQPALSPAYGSSAACRIKCAPEPVVFLAVLGGPALTFLNCPHRTSDRRPAGISRRLPPSAARPRRIRTCQLGRADRQYARRTGSSCHLRTTVSASPASASDRANSLLRPTSPLPWSCSTRRFLLDWKLNSDDARGWACIRGKRRTLNQRRQITLAARCTSLSTACHCSRLSASTSCRISTCCLRSAPASLSLLFSRWRRLHVKPSPAASDSDGS